MIVVFPLQKHYAEKFVWGSKQLDVARDWPRGSRTWANKKLPALYTAFDTETKDFSTWGFRSRQTSYSCQLTLLGGMDRPLCQASLIACVYAAVIELRKRVEVYNQFGSIVDEVLRSCGFVHEGYLQNYTEDFRDVNLWGITPVFDQVLPVLPDDVVKCSLVWNDEVNKYIDKNTALYEHDQDWNDKVNEVTLGQRLLQLQSQVLSNPKNDFIVSPGWHGDPDKSTVKLDFKYLTNPCGNFSKTSEILT